MGMVGIVSFIYLTIILALAFTGIYCMLLFIKLANSGIKAFDIYINEKTNNKS
ncbi:MAG TPA: hypothetical protein VIK72_02070 [Clostridiaceae bacterium]